MGFSVVRNRITLTKGDSAEITLTIRDRVKGETFVPGPHDQLTFTVKRGFFGGKPAIVKTLDHGIIRNDDSCVLVLVPSDTENLPFGVYRYDVELVLENGYTDTVIPPSPFILTREVTTHG